MIQGTDMHSEAPVIPAHATAEEKIKDRGLLNSAIK